MARAVNISYKGVKEKPENHPAIPCCSCVVVVFGVFVVRVFDVAIQSGHGLRIMLKDQSKNWIDIRVDSFYYANQSNNDRQSPMTALRQHA